MHSPVHLYLGGQCIRGQWDACVLAICLYMVALTSSVHSWVCVLPCLLHARNKAPFRTASSQSTCHFCS